MGEHPAADQEEGLDRTTAQDDAAGGTGSWGPRADPGCVAVPPVLGRLRDQRAGESPDVAGKTLGFPSCGCFKNHRRTQTVPKMARSSAETGARRSPGGWNLTEAIKCCSGSAPGGRHTVTIS